MGRRIRYRRYVGRRKSERGRSRIIILCVLIFTALVVYLSVMLGLDLREKAEKVRAESEFLSTVETTPTGSLQPPVGISISKERVNAPFVSVSDVKNLELPENTGTLSAVLKSKTGQLFYRSPAVEAISGPQDQDLPTPETVMSALSKKDHRVSVVFHRESTEGMEDIAAQAILDMEVLQMCEIAKAGASEILLMGFYEDENEDEDADADGMTFLASAAEKIRAANPQTLVGAVLPLSSASNADLFGDCCRSLAEFFDVIALDLTTLDGSDESVQKLHALVDTLQISFTRYNVRCIFADGTENVDRLTAVLDSALLSNYQLTSETGLKKEAQS